MLQTCSRCLAICSLFVFLGSTSTYLDPGLGQVHVGRDLFSHGAVRVVSVAEHSLQFSQLLLGEGGSNPALFLRAVKLFQVGLVRAVGGCLEGAKRRPCHLVYACVCVISYQRAEVSQSAE